jgi:hypothetical protein
MRERFEEKAAAYPYLLRRDKAAQYGSSVKPEDMVY